MLRRKLAIVEKRYRRSQLDYERNAILAVSSVYGIDLLTDNVDACRGRLLGIFERSYGERYGKKTKEHVYMLRDSC